MPPGKVFEVEHQGDWYPVGVTAGHQVLIGNGKVIHRGPNLFGLGSILMIDGGSYESRGRLVSPGRKARIPFPQEGVIVAPREAA